MGTVVLADVTELQTVKFSEMGLVTSVDSVDRIPVIKNEENSIISPSNLIGGTAGFSSPTKLTVSGGTVTVVGNSKFRFHTIDTELDDATDDLDTILGGNVGDIFIGQAANNSRTIVWKNGVGLKLAADFSENNILDKIILLCITPNVWHELTRSSNGA